MVTLPEGVKVEDMKARLRDDGVLAISAPLSSKAPALEQKRGLKELPIQHERTGELQQQQQQQTDGRWTVTGNLGGMHWPTRTSRSVYFISQDHSYGSRNFLFDLYFCFNGTVCVMQMKFRFSSLVSRGARVRTLLTVRQRKKRKYGEKIDL